jgi:hypothetical protein
MFISKDTPERYFNDERKLLARGLYFGVVRESLKLQPPHFANIPRLRCLGPSLPRLASIQHHSKSFLRKTTTRFNTVMK